MICACGYSFLFFSFSANTDGNARKTSDVLRTGEEMQMHSLNIFTSYYSTSYSHHIRHHSDEKIFLLIVNLPGVQRAEPALLDHSKISSASKASASVTYTVMITLSRVSANAWISLMHA
jgi:hypothetical protein